MIKKLLSFLLLVSFSAVPLLRAQVSGKHSPGVNWMIEKPFEQKVFIENKGQFNGKDGLQRSGILYGVDNLGTNIYFTPKGLTYKIEKIDVKVAMEESDDDVLRKAAGFFGKKKEEEVKVSTRTSIVSMQWIGANPNPSVTATDMVSDYYNYDVDGTVKNAVSYARAYKKLTYKDIYPNIDVEYVFHPKEGIKYTLILHPGADASLIKMKYSSKESIAMDKEGNIHFKTQFGDITDHVPVSFYSGNNVAVASSFILQGNEVSFKLGDYDHTKTVLIDPWTINPSFTSANKVFDVEPDKLGNVYAYGGSGPWKLKKFDATGALIWTFNNPNTPMFGDFDVVMQTGISYITTGLQGSITKVMGNGTLGFNQTVVCNYEYWTVNANCKGNTIVVSASFGGSNTSGLAFIDTSTGSCSGLVNFTIAGGNPDMRCAVWSPNNNFYLTQTHISQVNQVWGRTSTFAPIFGPVYPGYNSPYNGTPLFAVSFIQPYNGIDADFKYIYLSSGLQLFKNNITTGVNISSVNIPGGGLMSDNGVAVDACGFLYVGSTNGVYKFDSTLVQVSTQATNAVYDVTLGPSGEVLAGGDQFLASLNFNACPPPQAILPLTTSSTATGCNTSVGTASVTATGGSGSYTYTWSNGQTSQNITGLSSGTYTVTVNDNGCLTGTQTVAVSGNPITISSTQANVLCNGGTGTASVTANLGTSPYTYSWNSGNTTQNVTGLSAGTYTVTVTDANGCTKVQTVTITQPVKLATGVSVSVNPNCNGASTGSATVTTSGGTTGYTYTWSNGQTGASSTGMSAGTYTLVVTDNNGCTATATVTITQPAGMTLTTSNNSATCGSSNGSASITATGGSGSYTYSWSGGQTSQSVTGLSANTYTVVVADGNGCTSTQTVTVNNAGTANVGITTIVNIKCFGGNNGSATATASGGTGTLTYSWSPGGSTNLSATGLSAGTYTFTVTDSNGCTTTQTTQVTQPTALTMNASGGSLCPGDTANLNASASGGTGSITYTWNPGGQTGSSITVSPTITTTYTVTATDANGCTITKTVLVTVFPKPLASFTANPVSGQPPLAVTFTNTSTGGTIYSWTFGDGGSASTQNTNHTFVNNGQYTVKLVVTNSNGCKDSITMLIISELESFIIVPNVFSPNGDGNNDVFVINSQGLKDLSVVIFDRWGLEMGQFNTIAGGWDGKSANGNNAPDGTYYYILKAHGLDDKAYDMHGYLMLLR